VRHRERDTLGRIYGELIERAESDPDALVVSETSRNFMSKLRIGVLLDAGSQDSAQQRGVDVAFLHDVVARHAKEVWVSVPVAANPAGLYDHVPARWSYRRVSADDELKATNFLVCPRQPSVGWAYLDAVAAVVRQQATPSGQHMLPARQISFEDQTLKSMFEEVHHTAEWVATYDELLDKRQLRAQRINVIRYRRQRTNGRNMVVSSTSELRILRVLVGKRLRELNLDLEDDRLASLAQRMIDDALCVSGDIVLRAAKRGVSAGELIGIVLSRALVAEEFTAASGVAWFLLDDYAEWLGQREQGIADILALGVTLEGDGSYRLKVIVTEAKFVSADGSADAQRVSKQQLRQTILRIEDALFGDPGRMDRDLWLARIADLLLDGEVPIGQSQLLEDVRDRIRSGTMPIDLRGYSHVFISGPADGGGISGRQETLSDIRNGLQEVFSRQDLRLLIKAYEARHALQPLRAKLGSEATWVNDAYRAPSPRVSWIKKAKDDVTEVQSSDDDTRQVPEMDENLPPPESPVPEGLSARPQDADLKGAKEKSKGKKAPVPAAPHEAPEVSNEFDALVRAGAVRSRGTAEGDEQWLKSTEQTLRTAMMGYNLQAKVRGSRLTPNAALVRFEGSDRLRVEDIEAKQSALLTTHGLRLVSISPLPGEIVVAVARPQRQTVSLWDLWARRAINENTIGINTSFVIGLKELDGEILYLNLGGGFGGEPAHEPHTLIAGATGSGKSVLIQALILDIAATNPCDLAQIYLIDPKMGVDYSAIERLPHLQGGIIVDQGRAIEVLENLVVEMDRRYTAFREAGARDLKTYNQKAKAGDRLPFIFLIHDEFAEWMMTDTYKDAVASTVQRLGVKARAAGIHLFFAAQRPDANVMPVQLRDNLGNRLILKVASVGTAEIALGSKGAESLLGLGHLAARLSGQIIFAQAPFLSDEDIERVVDAIAADNRKA
jgi:S-DNA-T family DNA segregation ATPase FtsK/SpoIIIE